MEVCSPGVDQTNLHSHR